MNKAKRDFVEMQIVLEKQAEGGYTAYVPQLPGCISQGETKKETIENIKEAMELYFGEIKGEGFEELQENIQIIKQAVKING